MQKKSISDLIASFDEQSDKVKLYLADLLDVVKAGRVPSEDAMSTINAGMANLRTRYDAIYKMAQEIVSVDDIPENGAAVADILKALSNSRSKYICEQLERAKVILKKFIGIKSLIDEYASALAPYQSAAANLLAQMTEDTVEELIPQTEAPELFLDAMAIESIHNPAGVELMKRVQQHYPDMEITFGLIGKQYYFDSDTIDANLGHSESSCKIPAVDATLHIPGEIPAVQETAIPESTDAPVVSQIDNNMHDDLTGEDITTLHILNKVKIGVPSASNFKKEIDKMARYYTEVRSILPLFTNLGVLSKIQIYMMGICMDCFNDVADKKGRVYAAVDFLTEKGYLAKFMVDAETELYCLSAYGCGCMQKESIKQARNIFDISIGNVKLSANTEIQSAEALLFHRCNDVLVAYLWNQHRCLPKAEYGKIKESVKWCDNHYQVVFYNEGIICTAYLGLLLNDKTESNAMEIDATGIDAKYIIISRSNADHAFIFNDVFFLCENSSQNRKIQLEEYIKRQYRSWGVQENDNKVLNLQNSMIYENCVPTFSCVMLDRELFSAIDFDTPVERWLDWWLWIQISQMVPFLFINRKLTIWRLHSDSFNSVLSLSKQMSDREKWHLNLKRVIKSGTLSNKLIVHSPFLLVLIYSGIKMLKRKGLLFTVKKAGSVISTLLKH